MRKSVRLIVATGVLAASVVLPTGGASATGAPTLVPTSARVFANCAALNRVYRHGVARAKGVVDKTTGVKVRDYTVNKAVYLANYKRLDRDRDGIACEKH